jgi:DNA-binding NarL/FixJ family response regulator
VVRDHAPRHEALRILVVARGVLGIGLAETLAGEVDLDIVASVEDGSAVSAAVDAGAPDVVILGLGSGTRSVEAARLVRERRPDLPIVLIGADDDAALIDAATAGVRAVATREIGGHDLIELVRRVAAGGSPIDSALTRRLGIPSAVVRTLGTPTATADSSFAPLTRRQAEVAARVGRGLTNRQVAAELAISEQTVKNHLSKILQILSLHRRTEISTYALRRGWI